MRSPPLLALALAIAIVSPLVACAAARPVRDPIAGELHFLTPYVALRNGRCGNVPFVLVRHATSNVQIATDPPIREIAWELTVCGETYRFLLDCSPRPDVGIDCRGHEWPTPRDDGDWPLGLEAAAAVRSAPACPKGRSCRDRSDCSEDEVRAERTGSLDDDGGTWEVDRCGVRRSLAVRCPRATPRTCTASVTSERESPAAPASASASGEPASVSSAAEMGSGR